MASAALFMTLQSMQIAFQTIQSSTPTAWRYPATCELKNNDSFDYVIVGGGSSGCILANRLSANANVSVLLIEAGGYPPIETEMPGLFSLLVRSQNDYNFTSVDDGFSAQNLRDQTIGMTQGKMLGGSSAINHMMHTHGDPEDYNNWAKLLNDKSWNYKNMQHYLKKIENLVDPELLNSQYANLHGRNGLIKIARDENPINENYIKGFAELGHNIVMDVTSSKSALGFTKTLFAYANEKRQSTAYSYISPIKNRPNLCVALFTTAENILIKGKKAEGVLVSSNGNKLKLYANREVIVSAGALNTPKLLMLSGIGKKEHLKSFGIKTIVDLPVGENLQDHPTTMVLYQMEESTETAPSYPFGFPVPSFNGYGALDPSQSYADFMSISLMFTPSSSDFFQLCLHDFKYKVKICEKLFNATVGRKSLMSVIGLAMPKSRGQVLLASADPAVAPLIYTGQFSDTADVKLMGRVLKNFNKVLNTSYYKSINASMVDVGVCKGAKNEEEFWECYGVAMSSTMWHYAGTCAMGKVLDKDMRVKGVKSLRVVDASAMPTVIRAKINAGVMALAERGADIILNDTSS